MDMPYINPKSSTKAPFSTTQVPLKLLSQSGQFSEIIDHYDLLMLSSE